ncbi:MAG: ATP-binding cassette domain-containing protein [Clostridia bacterium]|nr:ATP-binding cassette domain-containing protein [Clostridia bacterium]
MPKIVLENITKRWKKFYAVENLNLVIEDNAFVTLLGPSGCGKTTTLRMIAGLETPTEGRITIGDKVVFDSAAGINIPANKRKVGFLFQNYALWPNMTVYENIAFGLKNINEPKETYDYTAKNYARLAEILKDPKGVADVVNDCRDKSGAVDKKKAYIKLIDAYSISMMTAKTLLGYDLQTDASKAAEITKDLETKLQSAIAKHKEKGEELDENFRVLKNGKPIVTKRKLTKEEVDLAVRRVSRIVKIGMFMDRYPAELSGGQQQRVAIARTLAPEPSVLFMDEPLSNLDAKLRLEMRYELQRLHVETGSTFVYVTHDQMEAMTLATSICLINNGVLQQYDPPLTVYNRPNNLFVADFVGNPSINFIETHGEQNADGSITMKLLGDHQVTFRPNAPISMEQWNADRDASIEAEKAYRAELAKQKGYVEKGNKDEVFRYNIARVEEVDTSIADDPVIVDGDFVLGVRPEFINLAEEGIEGEIYGAMPTGMESTLKIRVGEFLLTGVVFGGTIYTIGSETHIHFTGDSIMLFDRKSGRYITSGSIEI